ncbi:MAG: exosortase N, partial [Bacteroidetes bacterium]|nr:exosortase N [Bacteroidota bacterium]
MPAILYHLYYFYIILKGIDFAGKTVRILPFLFILLIFFAGYRLISIYLVNDFNLWLGLVLAPFILYVRKPYGHSVRFGLISIACLIIYHFVPVLSLYYIAFCSAILFVIENTTGKLNSGVFVLIVLLGSVTRYFVNIFGFAIRLKLTAAAGWLLNMAGYANRVEGNIIVHNNISFSVDEACMGLKMVITAFLVMLLFLTFFERRSNKYLPLWGIALLGITTMVLVIFGNLLRIMALVVLKCPPDAWSHEVIGIAGFILYVLLPLYLITPFIISFLGKKVNPYSMSRRSGKKKMLVLAPFLAGGLFLLNLFYEVKAMPADDYYASAGFTGFKKEICHHNIIKFYNDST